ncbi:hypothetical protein Tco_0607584 [Tanacetum coccineum]
MTKVIKGEFEKIKDIKVEDVSLTCDTQVEVFNNEVNRLSKMDDDSEHEADDDMGYDPSDIIRDDEVELTDEQSDNEDEIAEDIIGFKTYEDYKDDWIYEWNKDVPWVDEKPWSNTGDYEWYEAMKDSELKDEALRNKAIMEGLINEDDDESRYKQKRQWNMFKNDDAYGE